MVYHINMKRILSIFLLALVFVGINFAQKVECPFCCTPVPVQITGTITALNSDAQYFISRGRNVRIVFVQIENATVVSSTTIPVKRDGTFDKTIFSCYTYIIQPYVVGASRHRVADFYTPSQVFQVFENDAVLDFGMEITHY